MPHKATISIGTNTDRAANLRQCMRLLFKAYGALTVSPIYQSQAIGLAAPHYYNSVVSFMTTETAEAVNLQLKTIEQMLGRAPQPSTEITIDLDLLLFDAEINEDKPPILPHPDILSRACVLKPLSDIAGDEFHPVTELSFAAHWTEFSPKEEQSLQLVTILQ